jgi:hypothetical protein
MLHVRKELVDEEESPRRRRPRTDGRVGQSSGGDVQHGDEGAEDQQGGAEVAQAAMITSAIPAATSTGARCRAAGTSSGPTRWVATDSSWRLRSR